MKLDLNLSGKLWPDGYKETIDLSVKPIKANLKENYEKILLMMLPITLI